MRKDERACGSEDGKAKADGHREGGDGACVAAGWVDLLHVRGRRWMGVGMWRRKERDGVASRRSCLPAFPRCPVELADTLCNARRFGASEWMMEV